MIFLEILSAGGGNSSMELKIISGLLGILMVIALVGVTAGEDCGCGGFDVSAPSMPSGGDNSARDSFYSGLDSSTGGSTNGGTSSDSPSSGSSSSGSGSQASGSSVSGDSGSGTANSGGVSSDAAGTADLERARPVQKGGFQQFPHRTERIHRP